MPKMPEDINKNLFVTDDFGRDYLQRRSMTGDPEYLAEDWFKKIARPKLSGDPALKKIFAQKAAGLIAMGYDKDDVEAEWGMSAGLLPSPYEPADLVADIMTGFATKAGRQAFGLVRQGIKAGEKELTKKAGKVLAKEVGEEMGMGALAGAGMFVAQELGAGPIVEMLAGLVGPTATAGIMTLSRKGFATFLRSLRSNNEKIYLKMISEAEASNQQEFLRLVREIETPGGPPWKPHISPEPSVTMDELQKSPSLADYVLKRPETHPPDVIAEAQKLKTQFPDLKPTEPKPKIKGKKPKLEEEQAKLFEQEWAKTFGEPGQQMITKKRQEAIQTWMEIEAPDISDKAININFNRINTEDDIKDAIGRTAKLFEPEIQTARRGRISFSETEKLADQMGMSLDQLLKRRRGQAFNAEEALAARNMLISSAANLVELAKKAASPASTDVEKFAFRKAFNMHYAIQAQVSGMTAEAGRALSSFRIEAEGSLEKAKRLRDILFTYEGAVPLDKQAMMIATLGTTEGVSKAVKEAYKARTWDAFFEAWINGLLSGPQTHAVNTGSNALFALWQVPERYLAASFSKVLPGTQEIHAGEAAAQAWGLIEGFKDGLVAAGKTLKEGETADVLGKIEVRTRRAISAETFDLDQAGIPGRAVDALGEVVRGPSRFLMAEDDLFKAVGYRMELRAQAYRQAAMEGLRGEEFAKRMQGIINDPPENIRLAAQNAARYQTYTNELGQAGKAFQQVLNRTPALRLIIPFYRTGTNIAKAVMERTPLAFMSKRIMGDVMAGGARRDLALARISMGSMFMATAATLASQGHITGSGPPEPTQRAMMRDTGWQSYSIKVGDTYYKFSRIDPFGSFLGLAADAVEIMAHVDEVTAEEVAAMAVMAIAENVTSKTWIKGMTDFVEMMSDPKRYGKNYLERMAGTLIPTGVATLERSADPTFQEVNSWLDAIKARTPGLSKDLPPRLNIWGEPIVGGTIRGEEGKWFWLPLDMINPIYTSKMKASPAAKEILRLDMSVSMPAKQIESVKLTDEEYHRYIELQGNVLKYDSKKGEFNVGGPRGRNLKETLEFIIKNPQAAFNENLTGAFKYDELTDGPEGAKALVIEKVIQQFRQAARIHLRAEYPDLDRLINEMKYQRIEALTGEAVQR